MQTKPGNLTRLCMMVALPISASMAYGAAAAAALDVAALIAECKDQVTRRADTTKVEVSGSSGHRYSVPLYQLPQRRGDPDNSVVIFIQRGTDPLDGDVEVPRIAAIFVRTVKTGFSKKGDFELETDPKEQIPFIIHLDRGSTSPNMSGKTHWRSTKATKPNQNIGLAVYSDPDQDPPRPGFNDSDWPCKDKYGHPVPKSVDVSVADAISFLMCANAGHDVIYAYEIRMQQVGHDNVEADIGIDPLIINHPK